MLTGIPLGQAIAEAIKLKGVTPTEVAAHFGIKPPSVHNWMSTGRIGKDKLSRLFQYFSDVVKPDHWGMAPPEAAIIGMVMATGSPLPSIPDHEFVAVARVRIKASAGITGFTVEHIDGNGPPVFFRADWIAAKGFRPERLYALHVSGDSMEPSLWDGDLVVINTDARQPRDGAVFVANYEGEVTIKRLLRDAGEWWLISDNQRYRPKRCDEHAILIGHVIYKQSERV